MKSIWKVDGGEFCSKTYYFNRFGAVFAGVKVLRISESGIATEQRLELQCELGRVLFPFTILSSKTCSIERRFSVIYLVPLTCLDEISTENFVSKCREDVTPNGGISFLSFAISGPTFIQYA